LVNSAAEYDDDLATQICVAVGLT